jgi:hypothetical protein
MATRSASAVAATARRSKCAAFSKKQGCSSTTAASPLAGPGRERIPAYLDYRTTSWPNTANPHLFISFRSALETREVSHRWIKLLMGPDLSRRSIREDRILAEAPATRGDPRRLHDLSGLSIQAGTRYTKAADGPGLDPQRNPQANARWAATILGDGRRPNIVRTRSASAKSFGIDARPEDTAQVINVPNPVRRSVESQGPAGRAWLAALPRLVDELCHEWSLTLDDPLLGGKWAYVARVRVANGDDAVLKVALPTPDFARQIDTIAAANGRGYVHLYDADPARHAMLMEPLGPMMPAAGWSVEQMLAALGATLLEAWKVPRPAEAAVPPRLRQSQWPDRNPR